MIEIDSPMLGKVIQLDESDIAYATMKKLIADHPLNGFQLLNKEFNKRGFCLAISTLEVIQ